MARGTCCCGVHYAWAVAAVIFAALMMAGGIRATPGILTVSFETEFGWSRALIAGAVSINILLYGLVGPFAAAVLEQAGIRVTLLAALAALALGSGLTVLMSEPYQLYLLWGVLVGLAAGVIAPTLGKVVANRWFVSRNGLVMGLFSASASTGQVSLAPALGALVEWRGWRAAALAVALLGAALMPVVAGVMVDHPASLGLGAYGAVPPDESAAAAAAAEAAEDGVGGAEAAATDAVTDAEAAAGGAAVTPACDPPQGAVPSTPTPLVATSRTRVLTSNEAASASSPPPPLGRPRSSRAAAAWAAFTTPLSALAAVWRDPDFALLAGSFFVCGASTNGLIGTHLVPACRDHGMSETTASGFLAGVGAFDIVGTIGSGWLTDRADPRVLLSIYYGLRGLALVALPWAFTAPDREAALWPWAALYGLDWIATVPPTARLCTDCFGVKRSAVIFGWCLAAHQVGAAFAAAAAGAVRTSYGSYSAAFWASGGLAILTSAAVTQIGRRHRLVPSAAQAAPAGVGAATVVVASAGGAKPG